MWTIYQAAAKTSYTQLGFLTTPGHMRLVLPLLKYTNLLMYLTTNLLMYLTTNLLMYINLLMEVTIKLPMPVTPSLPTLVTTSQSTQHSLVTTTLLVTTRDLGIILLPTNLQVNIYRVSIFYHH